jgi:hypothetical protein
MHGTYTSSHERTQDDRGKRAEIQRRYRWQGRQRHGRSRPTPLALRRAEIECLLTDRYGNRLPDDDAGRDDAIIMCHHQELRDIAGWLRRWAPWMHEAEIAAIKIEVRDDRTYLSADALGRRLGLTDGVRTKLKITTIGAVDVDKAARNRRRKAKARERERQRRAADGAKSRAEYRAAVASDAPWKAARVSRATWYRRRGAP